MYDMTLLEECFKKYTKNISEWLPEDIIDVDIHLLKKFNLLNYHDTNENDPNLTRYFHVIESSEKITLINDDFVIWIVPEKVDDIPVTFTMIALNGTQNPELELCFVTTGVYNTSRLVLRVLEKFLQEIEENEKMLENYNK